MYSQVPKIIISIIITRIIAVRPDLVMRVDILKYKPSNNTNTTKGTIMNKIRRWVLIHLLSHYVLEVIWITVWIVDTRWNICIVPFTYYYMPRRKSVLSNCICFVYFITYFLLGHSQGPKGYHYYYNCDNNCCKTKPGQEGWYFKISTFVAPFQEKCDFLDI